MSRDILKVRSFDAEKGRECERPLRDADRKIIFVGGFPIDMTETGLRQYMEAFGDVDGVFIETKGGFSKGFGRVTFKEASVAGKVVGVKHALRGKPFTCTYYLTPEEAKQRLEDERKRKVFVSGLKKSTKDNTLLKYFSQFGDVERIIINRYKDNTSKGTSFVLFSSEDTVQYLLSNKELKTHNIDGSWATVFQCLSKNDIISFTSAINHDQDPKEETTPKPIAQEHNTSAPKLTSSTDSMSEEKEEQKGRFPNSHHGKSNKHQKTSKKQKCTYKALCEMSQTQRVSQKPSQEPQNLPFGQGSTRPILATTNIPYVSLPAEKGDESANNYKFNIGPIHLQTAQQVRFLKWKIKLLGAEIPVV